MFGWVSRCWGNNGTNSSFEKARIRSVTANWEVPQDNDVSLLINSFKGQNPQIQAQIAFNSFLSRLEMSEEKTNPLFLLKHLYVFDHLVEQGVALQKIANYYSSEFFIFKHGSSIEFNPLRQLVATYFLYIKKKAEVYQGFQPKYYAIKKAERELLIHPLNFAQIFAIIDKCFDIQKAINEINNKYKSHNKGSELIQMIFTMMLKTYLFCYSLVSISTKTLFCRIKKFNKTQMIKFYRFVRYYNKQYTRQLYDFVQSNKDIYEFKNFKYSQIILIDQSYVDYLEKTIYKLDKQPLALNTPQTINIEEEEKILQLPNDIFLEVVETLIVDHQLKKKFNVAPVDHELMLQFEQYQNCYSDNFESDFQSSRRQEYNERQAKNPEADVQTQMTSSKCLSTSKRLQFEETMCSSKFDNDIWNSWQNVYSS